LPQGWVIEKIWSSPFVATKTFDYQKECGHVLSFCKNNPQFLFWATEKFQLPSDNGGVSDGDE
jgi:hypothetical protein